MKTSTKETIEIKAGELNLKAPYTIEGLKVVWAMVTLLEEELIGEKKAKKVGGAQPKLGSSFSPVKLSPKQRILYRDWNAIAKGRTGTVYEEVLNAFLKGYKKGEEPSAETSYRIIREMYGEELSKGSIAVYANMYKAYIRENKLAVKHSANEARSKAKELLPMDKVVEIWKLLPSDFTNKQVKALVPAHIMQTAPRIDTTNFIIKQFLDNPEFECVETSPGMFSKMGNGGEE